LVCTNSSSIAFAPAFQKTSVLANSWLQNHLSRLFLFAKSKILASSITDNYPMPLYQRNFKLKTGISTLFFWKSHHVPNDMKNYVFISRILFWWWCTYQSDDLRYFNITSPFLFTNSYLGIEKSGPASSRYWPTLLIVICSLLEV
jgi:hypothetical protein